MLITCGPATRGDLGKLLFGLVQPALLQIALTEIFPCQRVIRIDRQGLVIVGETFVDPAEPAGRMANGVENYWIVWLFDLAQQRERLTEQLFFGQPLGFPIKVPIGQDLRPTRYVFLGRAAIDTLPAAIAFYAALVFSAVTVIAFAAFGLGFCGWRRARADRMGRRRPQACGEERQAEGENGEAGKFPRTFGDLVHHRISSDMSAIWHRLLVDRPFEIRTPSKKFYHTRFRAQQSEDNNQVRRFSVGQTYCVLGAAYRRASTFCGCLRLISVGKPVITAPNLRLGWREDATNRSLAPLCLKCRYHSRRKIMISGSENVTGRSRGAVAAENVVEVAVLCDDVKLGADVAAELTSSNDGAVGRAYRPVCVDLAADFISQIGGDGKFFDMTLLVVDGDKGLQAPDRHRVCCAHALGVAPILVAIAQLDATGAGAARFDEIRRSVRTLFDGLDLAAPACVPMLARTDGDDGQSSRQPGWHDGVSLIDAIDGVSVDGGTEDRPLRLAVYDVVRDGEHQTVVGRILSGRIQSGNEVMFSPLNKSGLVQSIDDVSVAVQQSAADDGYPAQMISVRLEEPLPLEAGELISHLDDLPIETDVFRARLAWFGKGPLEVGRTFRIRLNRLVATVRVQEVGSAIESETPASKSADRIETGQVGNVVLRARRIVALDEFTTNPGTGRFIILDDGAPAGGGIVFMEGYADQRDLITQASTNITRVAHSVPTDEREERNGHMGGVVWLTGLSGSGKSTLATELERRLHDKGFQAFVLDGDNVRHGLNANLGFSPEDRAENIRRVGEVAALFARAGLVAITAFISPYRSDRDRAREAAGDRFCEVHVSADLDTCERRDPKGLYKKARAGKIGDFTGISAPYEAPDAPDIVIDTAELNVDESVDELVAHVERTLRL